MDTLAQVLKQDLILSGAMADSVDFVEGVRALLVDRDNAPHWHHHSLVDVNQAMVSRLFTGGFHVTMQTPRVRSATAVAGTGRECSSATT